MIGWKQIKEYFKAIQDNTSINLIEEYLSKETIDFILYQISLLEKPEYIEKLREIQEIQEKNGGGFFGLIPPVIGEDEIIPIPSNTEQIAEFLIFCMTKRKNAYEIMKIADYELEFSNNPIPQLTIKEFKEAEKKKLQIKLHLDFFGKIIDYFQKTEKNNSLLKEIIEHPILEELINHRNGLGYVPGPKFKKEFYKKFLEMANSKNPIENIWKVLHPWNFFNFADIYQNLKQYFKLYQNLLENKIKIEDYIASKLIDFIPQDREITENIAFSVEWAIKGWASKKYAGVNIEFLKDNYDNLFKLIIHEVFHRIQLRILPKPKSVSDDLQELDFDILFDFDNLDIQNIIFYRALSYIFLEGSATAMEREINESFTENEMKQIKDGLDLLQKIMEELKNISSNENDDEILGTIENMLNQGLMSNGPFYSLGEYISIQLMKKHGKLVLQKVLDVGIHEFYDLYFKLSEQMDEVIKFPHQLIEKIKLNYTVIKPVLK